MFDKNILYKNQKNLEHGGYIYEYKLVEKRKIKEIIMNVTRNWIKKVEFEFCNW